MRNIVFKIFIIINIIGLNLLKAQDLHELQKMADEDQRARLQGKVDWKTVSIEDSLRRVRVHELIASNKLLTGKDYLNAGIIFQHGNDTISSEMAVKSFGKALQLDSTLNKWWYAAAVDRDLMRKGKPQIYGTQFIKNAKTNNRWVRYVINPSVVTDKQRKYYRVETLKEQEEKERTMNLMPFEKLTADKTLDNVLKDIKTEFLKRKNSDYNVSEESINNFGYKLLAEGKKEGASKVFKLNTELYPKSWNVYDSYGEVLLLLGNKNKAKANYQKSLKLNPKNDNAKQILKELLNKK